MATTRSVKKGKSQVKRSNHERVGVGGGQTILVKSHNAPPSYKPCRVKPFSTSVDFQRQKKSYINADLPSKDPINFLEASAYLLIFVIVLSGVCEYTGDGYIPVTVSV